MLRLSWQTARGLLLASLLLLVAACVTTTESSKYTKEVDKNAAVQSHVAAATDYLRVGNAENALRHLRKAEQIDDKSALVYAAMAYAFELNKDTKLAGEYYQKAIRLDPSLTSARNNYGVFLLKQNDPKGARKQFREVVEDTLYENRAAAFFSLGRCEVALGNTDAAEHAFVRSITLDRRFSPSLLELALINLERTDLNFAQQYYDAYRQQARSTPRSLWVGYRLAQAQNDKDAIASHALALKNLYPDSEEYSQVKSDSGDNNEN